MDTLNVRLGDTAFGRGCRRAVRRLGDGRELPDTRQPTLRARPRGAF
jgi:hypothetical protein